MLDTRSKIFIIGSILLNLASVCFLSASLGTDWWVNSLPERQDPRDVLGYLPVNDTGTRFRGQVHFGLFRGTKILNEGLGEREVTIWGKYQTLIRKSYW